MLDCLLACSYSMLIRLIPFLYSNELSTVNTFYTSLHLWNQLILVLKYHCYCIYTLVFDLLRNHWRLSLIDRLQLGRHRRIA